MYFKKYNRKLGFPNLELEQAFGTSLTQHLLKEMDLHVDWEPIETFIKEPYPVGIRQKMAYPFLMLLKAMLLKK